LILSLLTAILFLSTGKEINTITSYKSRTRPS
jgi:hypothetical protein